RVLHLAVAHRLDIGVRVGIGGAAARQPRHPPAEDDPLQVLRLAQVAARVVQALADAQAAPGGVDADLHAVQPLALGIVPRAIAAAGDLVPGVRPHGRRLVDAEAGGVADDLALELDHEL